MSKFNKLVALDTFRWERVKGAELCGKYDFPQLNPCANTIPENLVPFHMANSTSNAGSSWFHFYIDDYRFERIWNRPDRYLPVLQRFEGGITPDFSMYFDMPKAQQIWNCWRNRAMAYWMQQNGLKVIPNACWGDEESLEWAFDGLPSESVLAVTTQGCMGCDYVSKQLLLNGLHELARQKRPEKLIVYGTFPDSWRERFPFPIIVYNTFSREKWGA